MNSILFLGYSRLVQRKLITAARSAGFEQIEVSSKRHIEEIPNVDFIHKGYEKSLECTNCNLVFKNPFTLITFACKFKQLFCAKSWG